MRNEIAQVDVLIPVYNAQATVAQAVASIQAQTVRDIRIVVVDDGSTDATGAILADIAVRDPRVEVITRPNGGIVDALNTGLAICTAEFLARHDADDLAFPDRFERQLAFLRARPDFVAVDGRYWHIDAAGSRSELRIYEEEEAVGDFGRVPSLEPYLSHPFLMVRRSLVQDVGGYRHVLHAEDTDLYWRLADKGRLGHLGEILGEYRIHAGSISGGSVTNARISAVNSQLAAVSAKRRANGREDLVFRRETLARYKQARTLRDGIEIGMEQLDADERAYLEVAASAKLLETASIRTFPIDRDDARTITAALNRHAAVVGPRDARKIGWLRARMTARLLEQGKLNAARLISPGLIQTARVYVTRVSRKLGLA